MSTQKLAYKRSRKHNFQNRKDPSVHQLKNGEMKCDICVQGSITQWAIIQCYGGQQGAAQWNAACQCENKTLMYVITGQIWEQTK